MFENSIRLKYLGWEADILPSFGANTISLKNHDSSILRSPQSMEDLIGSPYLYGMPLLFPPNRIEGGKFQFEGKTYNLDINEPLKNNHIHGLMFDAPFSVIHLDYNRVRCVYENKGERYPFAFKMYITYTLDEKGFTQEIDIENTSDTAMPVLLALHTSFCEPETFSVPLGKRWETNENYIPTGNLLNITAEEQEYILGCSPKDKKISGFFTAAGNTARIGDYFYRISKNFTQWILFNNNGNKGFLCVEPQSGPVNGLNIPHGYIRLKTGETVKFWTNINDK